MLYTYNHIRIGHLQPPVELEEGRAGGLQADEQRPGILAQLRQEPAPLVRPDVHVDGGHLCCIIRLYNIHVILYIIVCSI